MYNPITDTEHSQRTGYHNYHLPPYAGPPPPPPPIVNGHLGQQQESRGPPTLTHRSSLERPDYGYLPSSSFPLDQSPSSTLYHPPAHSYTAQAHSRGSPQLEPSRSHRPPSELPHSNETPVAPIKPTLKRNQACLQCRRRKLKCDAARPHCKTCLRSYNHALRGAEAARRERIRDRQRERGVEEKDELEDDGEEPPAESFIPPLSCTYEDPIEIQAKRQESAALTQKRYGQQIGAARILVEGLAGGSGRVRVDSSGDEGWDGARSNARKRSVGSLVGDSDTVDEGRAGKKRDRNVARTSKRATSRMAMDMEGVDRKEPRSREPEGRSNHGDPDPRSRTITTPAAPSPSLFSRRPSVLTDNTYRPPPQSYPPPPPPHSHQNNLPPPPLTNPSYPFRNAQPQPPLPSLPPHGPPMNGHRMMHPGQSNWGYGHPMAPGPPPPPHGIPVRGYENYGSPYDRPAIPKEYPSEMPFPPHGQAAPSPMDMSSMNRPFSSNGPPPRTGSSGAEGSAYSQSRKSSFAARANLGPIDPGPMTPIGASDQAGPPLGHRNTFIQNSEVIPTPSSMRMNNTPIPIPPSEPMPPAPWNGLGPGPLPSMPPVIRNSEAVENTKLKSKISWLEDELKQAYERIQSIENSVASNGPPPPMAVDTKSGQDSSDGNMLSLLSQAIDQNGYQPLAVPDKKTTLATLSPDSKAAPRSVYDLGPAQSWAPMLDNSRARSLANILNEIPSTDMSSIPTGLKNYALQSAATNGVPDQATTDSDKNLWDLLWPGWHRDLPDPELMDHLVQVFFSSVPTVTRLFHYDTFKARMALPATHKDFPNVAVLHGICATAARYTARVFTCNPEDQPWLRASEQLEDPRTEEDFGIRHSLYAWQAVNRQLCQGVHIYDCAQALMLLANHNHLYGRWVEGWISIGLAGRLMAPLGLNQRERAGGALGPSGRGDLLSPALNGIEREERRALFWTVFLYDVQVSASSGWGGSMQMDEIMVPLPAGLEAFEAGINHDVAENEQSLSSSDMYTRHPVQDGFVLHVKAIALFNRVGKFIRMYKAKRSCGRAEVDMRATKDFQAIDAAIGSFLLTFPPALRDPLTPSNGRIRKPIDIDLFNSQVLLHQMTIFLHEPFADLKDPDDTSTLRLLASSRAILKMVFTITSTCLDLSLIVRADFGLYTAARTLVLFLKNVMETGDTSAGSEEQLRSEIEVFRLAFTAHGKRFPLGLRHCKVLGALLDACDNTTASVVPDPSQGPKKVILEIEYLPKETAADENENTQVSSPPDAVDLEANLYKKQAKTNGLTFLLNEQRGFIPNKNDEASERESDSTPEEGSADKTEELMD